MFRILLALLLMTSSAMAGQWRNGVGEQTLLGTSNSALIGYNSYNSIVSPLDNLISNQCNEWLQYNSSTLINVMAGTCVVSNSQGSIRLILMDTSNTTLSSSNLDTGSLTASTKYYIYSTAATNAATTSTYYISANSSAPSGATYYYQIGYFTTDSNTQITGVTTNNVNTGYVSGTPVNKSESVVYQALTDGDFYAEADLCGNGQVVQGYTGSISGSMTNITRSSGGENTNVDSSIYIHVRKGDYYEYTENCSGSPHSTMAYFVPNGK